jgi:hypothetical protein
MIITFWSSLGFPMIQTLPPKMTFTAKFFVDNILPDVLAAKRACQPYRRPVLHMDTASPHRAVLAAQKLEGNGIVATPHPASSSDLVPSHFFLFGALKGQFAGRIYESAYELVEEIYQITNPIP